MADRGQTTRLGRGIVGFDGRVAETPNGWHQEGAAANQYVPIEKIFIS